MDLRKPLGWLCEYVVRHHHRRCAPVHRRTRHCLLDRGDADRPTLPLALHCGAHTIFRGDKVDAVVARRDLRTDWPAVYLATRTVL
jgi:hypothetical protein